MIPSLIILGVLVAAGLALFIEHKAYERRHRNDPAPEPAAGDETPAAEPEECCGQHAVCERDSLLAAVSEKIEYYDDEELDAYRGRDPEEYSDAETEEFRDVLLTLLPSDIAGWARSLQLRGISLPSPVRDELVMMVGEMRREAAERSRHD